MEERISLDSPERLMKIANAIKNRNRLSLLHYIIKNPGKTLQEISINIHDNLSHRETVYKYLNSLIEAGLIVVSTNEDKRLVYTSTITGIELVLKNDNV